MYSNAHIAHAPCVFRRSSIRLKSISPRRGARVGAGVVGAAGVAGEGSGRGAADVGVGVEVGEEEEDDLEKRTKKKNGRRRS